MNKGKISNIVGFIVTIFSNLSIFSFKCHILINIVDSNMIDIIIHTFYDEEVMYMVIIHAISTIISKMSIFL